MEVAAGDLGEENVQMLVNSVKSGNLDKFITSHTRTTSNR